MRLSELYLILFAYFFVLICWLQIPNPPKQFTHKVVNRDDSICSNHGRRINNTCQCEPQYATFQCQEKECCYRRVSINDVYPWAVLAGMGAFRLKLERYHEGTAFFCHFILIVVLFSKNLDEIVYRWRRDFYFQTGYFPFTERPREFLYPSVHHMYLLHWFLFLTTLELFFLFQGYLLDKNGVGLFFPKN